MLEFYLKLKLILRIISYLTYICWEIDNFVIKYFMFGKYNGFVSKARVSACMYFLVHIIIVNDVIQVSCYIGSKTTSHPELYACDEPTS